MASRYIVDINATLTFVVERQEDGTLRVTAGYFDDRDDGFPTIRTETTFQEGKLADREVEWGSPEYDAVIEVVPGKGAIAVE